MLVAALVLLAASEVEGKYIRLICVVVNIGVGVSASDIGPSHADDLVSVSSAVGESNINQGFVVSESVKDTFAMSYVFQP